MDRDQNEARATEQAILNDLERTFADMPMVAPRKPQIFRILQDFASGNPDIGYTQGMNYVAATLVLKFHPREDTARKKFNEVLLQFSGFWSFQKWQHTPSRPCEHHDPIACRLVRWMATTF
ncbi:unnamed protein product [Effrenium voratum]|uniref:Rab-GAP TBC domain-containing protein n=1 Tax=Effrenium voratum TaxID=2562239 RepID=A0AA36HZ48_9DINO|nr:unnamed protein product [Effrenium voratum]